MKATPKPVLSTPAAEVESNRPAINASAPARCLIDYFRPRPPPDGREREGAGEREGEGFEEGLLDFA